MQKIFAGAVAATCCLTILIKPSAFAATAKLDSEEKVIVDAIIALSATLRVPQVDRAENLGNHTEASVESLLLLLDRHNSNEALRQISRLNYYYIGEAPGEIYDCVVARKSYRIVPYLKATMTRKKSECEKDWGKGDGFCDAPEKIRDRVASQIERIKAHERNCLIDE